MTSARRAFAGPMPSPRRAAASRAEARFRAMGTDCHILVVAPQPEGDELVGLARERVDILEQCWSRFRHDSELSHLNASAGRGPQAVSDDLLVLVQRMRDAWRSTAGLFDPTVLTSIRAMGYDADFSVVSQRSAASITDIALAAAPGMSAITVDVEAGTVSLPAGVGLDPGAIGKGLAADLIADELWMAGASGVLVNLGGDISVAGTADHGERWAIGIEDERRPPDARDRVLRILEFPEGTDRLGIATSTTLKRRWAQGRRHHVIDPRTGSMSTSELVQVTVVAGRAWEAETQATTALLMHPPQASAWLGERGLTGILLTADDEVRTDEGVIHG